MSKLTASIISHASRTEFVDEMVLSCAQQTRKPKEVILLYRQFEDENIQSRMNRGIAMSTADAYVMMGDDDKLHPEFLEKTLAIMEEQEADIVYTHMQEFGDRNGIHGVADWSSFNFRTHFGIFYSSLVRKSLWERVGGYDVRSGPFLDWDFWWMCKDIGAKAIRIPEPLFLYRTHGDQDSQTLTGDMKTWSREYILSKHNFLDKEPIRKTYE